MKNNLTLLIVEDEDEARKGYQEFLTPSASAPSTERKSSRRSASNDASPSGNAPTSTEQYRLIVAASGEEALELVRQEMEQGGRIAGGFFDVKLGPGIDGLETIQHIKKMDPEVRCTVVTAYHDRSVEDIHKLFGEEFKDHWDYLNKPFSQGEIVQKARQMVSAWNKQAQLKEVQAQLIQSERLAAIGQVAKGVGHEFGNILLRIMGKADLAVDETNPEKIKNHLEVILQASERASVIVRNLQSFSKSEPTTTKSSMVDPIEQSLSLINHELVKASVTIEKKLESVPAVQIDPGAIAQVVLNLLINATHAIEGGGTVTVSLNTGKDDEGRLGVVCGISDTGVGIPDDVLPRIFEHAYSTKGDKGSGLGLAISKEIVESHGGKLTVQTKIGKGTDFTIWLPV